MNLDKIELARKQLLACREDVLHAQLVMDMLKMKANRAAEHLARVVADERRQEQTADPVIQPH